MTDKNAQEKLRQIAKYLLGWRKYPEAVWRASIAGILVGKNFRDVSPSDLEKFLEMDFETDNSFECPKCGCTEWLCGHNKKGGCE